MAVLHAEEVIGVDALLTLVQSISDTEKQALRDITVLQSPREGRFIILWEGK